MGGGEGEGARVRLFGPWYPFFLALSARVGLGRLPSRLETGFPAVRRCEGSVLLPLALQSMSVLALIAFVGLTFISDELVSHSDSVRAKSRLTGHPYSPVNPLVHVSRRNLSKLGSCDALQHSTADLNCLVRFLLRAIWFTSGSVDCQVLVAPIPPLASEFCLLGRFCRSFLVFEKLPELVILNLSRPFNECDAGRLSSYTSVDTWSEFLQLYPLHHLSLTHS